LISLMRLPLLELIFLRLCLIQERKGAEKAFVTGSYKVEWTFHNDLELIFVAVYQKLLQLLYVEELLESLKRKFCEVFARGNFVPSAFDKQAVRLRMHCEAEAQEAKQERSQKRFEETKRGKEVIERNKGKDEKRGKKDKKDKANGQQEVESDDEKEDQGEPAQAENGEAMPGVENSTDDIMAANRAALLKKKGIVPALSPLPLL